MKHVVKPFHEDYEILFCETFSRKENAKFIKHMQVDIYLLLLDIVSNGMSILSNTIMISKKILLQKSNIKSYNSVIKTGTETQNDIKQLKLKQNLYKAL